MTKTEPRLGLFARTFLLLALLMLASLGAWLHVFYTLEVEPRAQRSAAELVRSVQVSRAALLNAPVQQRESLRQAIDAQPNIQLRLASPSDETVNLTQDQYWQALRESVATELAADLPMAIELNGESSLWVQFPLEGQVYWMGVDIDQTYLTTGPEWISWVAAAALLSLIGAAVAVGYMNRPLARLSRAAQQLSRGQTPSPLPETGALEIRELNASFNRMVAELENAQNDRNLMLAGISHDLRTPLARMRLEIEMSLMGDDQRRAIDQDLSQVDRTIGQLLEYARPARQLPDKPIDLVTVVQGLVQEEQAHAKGGDLTLHLKTNGAIYCLMDQRDFARCLVNLIENARRYGVQDNQRADIEITVQTRNNRIYVDVKDRGPGIAAQDVARVMRPFSRGEMARTGGTGAGLGLSIVERLLSPASGRLRLLPREGGGLIARLDLPRARRGQRTSNTSTVNRQPVRLKQPS